MSMCKGRVEGEEVTLQQECYEAQKDSEADPCQCWRITIWTGKEKKQRTLCLFVKDARMCIY